MMLILKFQHQFCAQCNLDCSRNQTHPPEPSSNTCAQYIGKMKLTSAPDCVLQALKLPSPDPAQHQHLIVTK